MTLEAILDEIRVPPVRYRKNLIHLIVETLPEESYTHPQAKVEEVLTPNTIYELLTPYGNERAVQQLTDFLADLRNEGQ